MDAEDWIDFGDFLDSVNALLKKGAIYLKQGNHTEAAQLLKRHLELGPGNHAGWSVVAALFAGPS